MDAYQLSEGTGRPLVQPPALDLIVVVSPRWLTMMLTTLKAREDVVPHCAVLEQKGDGSPADCVSLPHPTLRQSWPQGPVATPGLQQPNVSSCRPQLLGGRGGRLVLCCLQQDPRLSGWNWGFGSKPFSVGRRRVKGRVVHFANSVDGTFQVI